ncbi:MAG: NAD-dependent epimerase/dehydratase family protein [Proteobacteria bacterium]|nr:NAD-dependent epimerase/dehydratase family protein [Pseudomonadota bacterium]
MKKEAVLVTGATGFIGKYVVENLLDEDFIVYALTRTNNPVLNKNVEIIKGDITESFIVPDEVGKIYHCAGVISEKMRMWPVNVQGTKNIVDAAIEHNCKLIHLSSAGVIGKASNKNINEETPCNPRSLYEKTKFEAEEVVREGIKRGLRAQMLRPTIVFGEGREPEKDSLLQLLRTIVSGRYRHISKGRGVYNIVYAGEVARAMHVLGNDSITNGRVFFINTPLSFSEFASIVYRSVKKNEKNIGNIPYVLAFGAAFAFSFLQLITGKKRGLTFSRLKALTDASIISQERMLNETGYKPLYGVDEYLKQLCAEYLKKGFLA